MAVTQDELYATLDLELSWSERALPEHVRTKHVHRLHPYHGKFIPQLVEVKEKRGPAYGEPVEAVTPEKQRRVRRAADTWLAARPELDSLSVAFDVVAVREGRLERLADAF